MSDGIHSQQQAINEVAQALQDGINVYEHIGRLYIQAETNKRALGLAITALQAMAPEVAPETTEPHGDAQPPEEPIEFVQVTKPQRSRKKAR